MTTKLTYVALVGAFCLAVVGTATTLSDKRTVVTPSDKGTTITKGSNAGKSDQF